MIERTLSTLSISVGTGLAIESLLSYPYLYKFNSFLINVRTIIRNAIDSFPKDTEYKVDDVVSAVKDDLLEIAKALVETKGAEHLDLIYYYPSYSSLPSMFPLAKIKEPETDDSKLTVNQKARKTLTEKVAKEILVIFEKAIKKTNVVLPDFIGDGLIITHHPVDLAISKSYTRLHLLESYTGTLKDFPQFYTKLTGSDKLSNIPLNKLTIQVFGDKGINFYSMTEKVKNAVKTLAIEGKWSSASTPTFVTNSIRRLNNNPDKEYLLKMI